MALTLALAPSAAWAQPAAKPSATAAAGAERRLALVVGNARYKTAPLNNPENDARVVGSTLRRLGFEVVEHVNLNARDFRRVTREFARRVQHEDGVALFYYAGHGVQIEGRNYLLPVDLVATDEDEVKDGAVDIDDLFVSRLERAKAPVRIVVLDACRDNPFATRTRSVRGGGLAEMGARGALIAFASAPGATAEDGPPGTNSVYTRHLAAEMLVEGIEVEQMFKNVRVKVLRDTQQRQIPWVNTSLTANFMFNPGRSAGSADDAARREELARLHALLEQRDREQRRLEAQLRELRARSEVAVAPALGSALFGDGTASGPAAIPGLTAAPAGTLGPTPAAPGAATVGPAAPGGGPAGSAAPAAAAPAAAGTTRVQPGGQRVVAQAPTAAAAPAPSAGPAPSAAPATPGRKPEAAMTTAPSPAATPAPAGQGTTSRPRPGALSERCAALLIRAQLGETLSPTDVAHMQKECR